MTLCMWVKHPDIEKCILSIASPEILCSLHKYIHIVRAYNIE